MHEKHKASNITGQAPDGDSDDCATYQRDMDEMRCILYSHGGIRRFTCDFEGECADSWAQVAITLEV